MLGLWSLFLQMSPVSSMRTQRTAKLLRATGGRSPGFSCLSYCLPVSSGGAFVSWGLRWTPGLCAQNSQRAFTWCEQKQTLPASRWTSTDAEEPGRMNRVRRPELEFPFCLSPLPVWPWAGQDSTPDLSLLICSMGIMILLKSPLSQG